MSIPAHAAFQAEAEEAVRAAWPAVEALGAAVLAPRIAIVAEPWRLLGSALDAPADAAGRIVTSASEGDFLALPTGPGPEAAEEIARARDAAGPRGIVVAYLAGGIALVPYVWSPRNVAPARPRFGLRSASRGAC